MEPRTRQLGLPAERNAERDRCSGGSAGVATLIVGETGACQCEQSALHAARSTLAMPGLQEATFTSRPPAWVKGNHSTGLWVERLSTAAWPNR